jgi:tRNA nucleotidyltransferase (CCA-adding enzyme)
LWICLTFFLLSSTCHAEIYKWVDANGQTHFSERRDDAGKAKALDLKVTSPPTPTQANTSSPQYWQEQEIQFKQRQIQKSDDQRLKPSVATKPKSLSGGKSDETDVSRCNLARDVIGGAVKHGNGAQTDKYDREVAENDIRAYCR